jgi:hypothetical protein
MDILLVLLRLIHIVAGVVWVGVGLAQTFLIVPAVAGSGESGLRFAKVMFTKTPAVMIFPVTAGLTMLAGILMYLFANSASHFSQTGNIVLGIGALAGIAAGIHGGAVTSRTTRSLVEALNQHVSDGAQAIAADGLNVIRSTATKLAADSRISLALMIIALIGMGSARYL